MNSLQYWGSTETADLNTSKNKIQTRNVKCKATSIEYIIETIKMQDSMNKLFALLPLKPLTTLWFSMLTSKETLMGSIP